MGILHDYQGFSCDECGNDNFETVVAWKQKHYGAGNMLGQHKLTLCPPCAIRVGAALIGDAREASVAFRRPTLGSYNAERIADPSLITKPMSSDDDQILDSAEDSADLDKMPF